jgi:hypothetical protein
MVVDLWYMLKRIGIVIESSFILYIVAKVAGAATFSTRHRKNPGPYPKRRDTCCALLRSSFLQVHGIAGRWRVSCWVAQQGWQ